MSPYTAIDIFNTHKHKIVVIVRIHLSTQTESFQIVLTGGTAGSVSGFVECGQKHTCKNCNDSDYHQQFDESEATSDSMDFFMLFEVVFHFFILSVKRW